MLIVPTVQRQLDKHSLPRPLQSKLHWSVLVNCPISHPKIHSPLSPHRLEQALTEADLHPGFVTCAVTDAPSSRKAST